MNSNWNTEPLSKCISLIIDYRGKTPKKLGGNWSDSGYRALSAKNVKTSGLVQENIIRRIDEYLYKKWMKEEVKRGDILLTSEAPLGEVLLWDSDEKIVLSQRLFAIRPNDKLDFTYLFYYMTSSKYQHELEMRSTGTTVVGIKQTQLVHTKIEYPNLNIQKKIAHILSTLDDKIEINRKMNETLEAMPQTLFKSWFVDFDPVHTLSTCRSEADLEAAATKLGISKEVLELFPSEFVESEMGMIPLGWEVKRIKDFGHVVTGKTPPTKKKENYGKEYPFITIPDMHNKAYIVSTVRSLSNIGHSVQPKKLIPKNSLIVSCIATVGLVSINSEDSHTNQQINSIVCDKLNLYYLYCLLNNMTDTLVMYGGAGTATLNVNKSTFENINILQPRDIELEAFLEVVHPIFSKILLNTNEIQKLQETRDTLLPKLLSGELDVSNLHIGEGHE